MGGTTEGHDYEEVTHSGAILEAGYYTLQGSTGYAYLKIEYFSIMHCIWTPSIVFSKKSFVSMIALL